MKILAIADRPPKHSILDTISQNKIDLICTLGDLNLFDLLELEKINNIPKIGVYGNHCSGSYFETLGIQNMHLQRFKIGNLIFGGFEGCNRYKESAYNKMYTQDEASKLLENFPYVDVLICHSPPFGVNDEPNDLTHQGFKALNKYIELRKPKYLFHGHTYPTAENIVTEYLGIKIIYVSSDMIVEIGS